MSRKFSFSTLASNIKVLRVGMKFLPLTSMFYIEICPAFRQFFCDQDVSLASDPEDYLDDKFHKLSFSELFEQ